MHLRNGVEKMIRKGKIMNNEMPDDIYIQLGENRIGTELCLRKWAEEPFIGGTKYVRADKAAPAWQPIETAPKDGTEVILSKWSGSYATPETSFCWAINGYFKDGYWYSKDPIIGKLAEPTHWMLLSQPPKEEINHD